jgi:LCP family protein required for cell wall assembly
MSSTEPRAALASALSFLIPGLGQAYNRQRRLAFVLAIPVLLTLGAAALAVSIAGEGILARLLDQQTLAGLLVLDVVLLVWRLVAIIQAHGRRAPFSLRAWPTWVTAALLAVTVGMHALPGWYAVLAIQTLGNVTGGADRAGPDDVFSEFGELPVPHNPPQIERGERINILLVGTDALPGRTHDLTDTMLVVSIDPDGGPPAMISVPRDLYGAPLPEGGTYEAKINSLMNFAAARPAEFPLGGPGTLKAAIGLLLGVDIHYFGAINLLGFKQAVDAIGGVEVEVMRGIYDSTYQDEYGDLTGFYLDPGTHYMDGHLALAYVRSRLGSGDNDFTRADRQQQLLAAIQAKLTAGNLLLALPGLLDAVENTIIMDIPGDQFSLLAQAVQDADRDALRRAVIQPPLVSYRLDPVAGSILLPDYQAIRALGQDLLGEEPESSPAATPLPGD